MVAVEIMTTDFEIIFSKENMIKAARVVAKKSSAGIDGIRAKDAVEFINNQYENIYNQLISGKYHPKPVLLKRIPKSDRISTRPIMVASVIDRIIQKVIYEAIYVDFDADMEMDSYGFRRNRNCDMAIQKLVNLCEQGYNYIIKMDLKECFSHLDQDLLLNKIRQKITDEKLLRIMKYYLKSAYIEDGNLIKSRGGSPQGSSLSPLYANIILDVLDKELVRRGHVYIRYADDICILCKSELAAIRIMGSINEFIRKKCKLIVNLEKTEIRNVDDGVDVLGFHIYRSAGRVHLVPNQKNIHGFKEKIKTACIKESSQELICIINPIIIGWVRYYENAEISNATKRLDLYVKKQLNKAEKRIGATIDRSGLKSCHEVYKVGRHLCPKQGRRHLLSGIDGRSTRKSEICEDIEVSYKERSPPYR